mgnify:CR=1 FL=1
MKKRIISALCVAIAGLVVIPAAASNDPDISTTDEWGENIQEYVDVIDGNDETIEKSLVTADDGEIILPQTEIDMAKDFYLTSGYEEKEAEELAIQYVKEINVLYQEAIANGYTVTDEEIQEHLDELKKQYETAENKDEIHAFMSKFENEQAYWDFQFEMLKKDLPIQKYNAAREQEFIEEQTVNDNLDEKLKAQEEWEDEFESQKEDAVEEYDFSIE